MVTVGASAASLLIIEDDPTVAEILWRYLTREGFSVDVTVDGTTGLARGLAGGYDLIVLDMMLPGLGGLEVFHALREAVPVPVIMLTALREEADRIAGLDLGADDYVAKPFSARELVARVKAVLRRARGPLPATFVSEVMRYGELEIDPRSRQVSLRGTVVARTAKEFDLLVFMASQPRRAFRRGELLQALWGYTYGDTATVTVHVSRLREKIEADPTVPRYLSTVRGVGYRFDP
jgi:DNA-binding response OmpR family regulator